MCAVFLFSLGIPSGSLAPCSQTGISHSRRGFGIILQILQDLLRAAFLHQGAQPAPPHLRCPNMNPPSCPLLTAEQPSKAKSKTLVPQRAEHSKTQGDHMILYTWILHDLLEAAFINTSPFYPSMPATWCYSLYLCHIFPLLCFIFLFILRCTKIYYLKIYRPGIYVKERQRQIKRDIKQLQKLQNNPQISTIRGQFNHKGTQYNQLNCPLRGIKDQKRHNMTINKCRTTTKRHKITTKRHNMTKKGTKWSR